MQKKGKNVICIDSDTVLLEKYKNRLIQKKLENYFFPFSDYSEALKFIEKQDVEENCKIHYIVINDVKRKWSLPLIIEKLGKIFRTTQKPEIIVCRPNANTDLRNKIMQNALVTSFLIHLVNEDYFEFLITGSGF